MKSGIEMAYQENNYSSLDGIYISALVPVYNEAETITEIVRRLEQISIIRQIVVVDDGSIDDTPAIVRRMNDAGRVVAHFHERNYGKGAALRHALEYAREDYLVIQDADLEYDPHDFYAMARVIQEKGAQVVYGSRFLGAKRTGMLWTHYLGNRLLTTFFNLLYGQRLTDMETCYKLFRTDLLPKRNLKIKLTCKVNLFPKPDNYRPNKISYRKSNPISASFR